MASVIQRGNLELSLRFDTFPRRARDKLEARITSLTSQLQARVEAAAPNRTGTLRSEITERIYANRDRVAGYVSVYAPERPSEYPKAATLEYGSNRARRIPDHGGVFHRLGKGQKSIESRLTKPARIAAFEYLRKPMEEMRPQITQELNEALAEAAAEAS